MSTQYVYRFGATGTEGDAGMKNLLGGKGANLAEMCRLGIAVPPGFTISTEACTVYTERGADAVLALLRDPVRAGVAAIETQMGKRFGDAADPLLLSVRSGARASMPGMMDTILNLGLNDEVVQGLARKAGNERFAWDSYRRFVQMYGDVVMGLKPVSKEEHDPFEVVIDMVKDKKGVKLDTELDSADLQELVAALQGADPRPHRPRLSHRPLGPAVGRGGGGVRELEQRPGRASIASSTTSRRAGALPSTCRPWCSATWASTAPPAWPSPATPAPAKTCSTANSSSTPRARTWWPASARRSR